MGYACNLNVFEREEIKGPKEDSKGCVSVTGGRLAVVYNGVLRQSLVENWRLSVGVYSVNYMRRDDGYLSVT